MQVNYTKARNALVRCLRAIFGFALKLQATYYVWRLARIRRESDERRVQCRRMDRAARIHMGRALRKGRNRVIHA